MLSVLEESAQKKLYLNIEALTKIINQQNDEYLKPEKSQEYEVEKIVDVLSREPLNILQKTEMGNIVLNYSLELAKERLGKIINEIFRFQ